jgi:hypothetical protein
MRLTATRSFVYGGRRLQPGDQFEARAGVARALLGVKQARAEAPEAPRQQPQPSQPPPPRDDERQALRKLAEAHGIEVDNRWGVDRLQEEIRRAAPDEPEDDTGADTPR